MNLLSIVIPTRNREYYCIAAIKNILSYNRYDFELVICDNSDSNIIENYLFENKDERVVYKHIKGRINSAVNMDTAMSLSTAEYICMIGDDDTILPSIFDIVKIAKNNNYENVTPSNIVSYTWPNENEFNGQLLWCSSHQSNCLFEEKNSVAQLNAFVKNGLTSYATFLPRVYHGLVKRAVVNHVFSITGHIIGGLSPDIYMSITTACICKTFIVTNKPFTIAGACPTSYTAQDDKKNIGWRIEDNPQLYKKEKYLWDNRVPKITTSQTIWADTALKAFEEIRRSDLVDKFNQGYLMAEMVRKNMNIPKLILLKSILKTKLLDVSLYVFYNFCKYYIIGVIKKIIRVVSRTQERYLVLNDIRDINQAVKRYLLSVNSDNL